MRCTEYTQVICLHLHLGIGSSQNTWTTGWWGVVWEENGGASPAQQQTDSEGHKASESMPHLPKQLWTSRYKTRLKEIIRYQDTVISGTHFRGQWYISHRKTRDVLWLKCYLSLYSLCNHLAISSQGKPIEEKWRLTQSGYCWQFWETLFWKPIYYMCWETTNCFQHFPPLRRSVKCSGGCQQNVKSANRESRGLIVSWWLTFHLHLIGWPEPSEGKEMKCWASVLLMVSVGGRVAIFIIVILRGAPIASKTLVCLCLCSKT